MSMTVNTDFASELLLNRIMNGQVKTQSGKTVTAGTRSAAARLDTAALAMGVTSAGVAEGKIIAQGTQNALTEVLSQLKSLSDILSDPNVDKTAISSVFDNNLDTLLATEIEGIAVLADTGKSITLDAAGNTLTVGNADLANATAFKALRTALGTSSPTTQLVEDAIKEVSQMISTQGTTYSLLANRVTMLDDLIGTYKEASTDQGISRGGSASDLLQAII